MMNMDAALKASIVITTKDRKVDLAKCLDSCLMLNGSPEIIVFDDGSGDGTGDFVLLNYPSVCLHREETSLGLINARTKAATIATGDIIFSLDDDACFSNENTVLDVLRYFDREIIGAVAIPYIDVLKSETIRQESIGTLDDIIIRPQYRGTAHALRRDLFLKLGGYRKDLVRQCEETDYCIRLYMNGYVVRQADSKPILHYESPNRNNKTIAFYAARNNLLIGYIYAPLVLLPFYLLRINLYDYSHFRKLKCTSDVTDGLISFLKLILSGKIKRTPMAFKEFYEYRILRQRGAKKLS